MIFRDYVFCLILFCLALFVVLSGDLRQTQQTDLLHQETTELRQIIADRDSL